MKTSRTFTALAVAAMLSAVAFNAEANNAAATPYQTQKEMLKTADEALTAITGAHAARMALFDNDIEAAKTQLSQAHSQFLNAEKDASTLSVADTENPSAEAKYLPFDMSMALTEDFKPTDQNKEVLKNASELMQSGKQDNAAEVLRAADIEVNVSAAMLPVSATGASFDQAQKLVDEGKYFEANLALKSIEDSVIVRNFSIDAIPVQGDAAAPTATN